MNDIDYSSDSILHGSQWYMDAYSAIQVKLSRRLPQQLRGRPSPKSKFINAVANKQNMP